ncbi:hypothetical protein ACTU44_11990 [Thalassospira sp. SM2505]
MTLARIENTLLRRVCVVASYLVILPLLLLLVALFVAWGSIFAVRDAVAGVMRNELVEVVRFHRYVAGAWRGGRRNG